MVIGVVRAELHMQGTHSLKDKRSIVRSVIAHAQHRFQVSVAEVGRNDHWNFAVLGFACVSGDTSHVDSVVSSIVRYLDGLPFEADLLNVQTEVIHFP